MHKRIKLTKEVLKIDAESWCTKIEEFIRVKLSELYRDGIVVAVSGGVDSSVTAALCVRAVGRERVTGLMLPERWQNPEADYYGRMIVKYLGIEVKKISITPILRGLGTSSVLFNAVSGREFWKKIITKGVQSKGESLLTMAFKSMKGQYNRSQRKISARVYSKCRVRLLAVYKYAEENNCLVVGAAHKSEDLVGLFSKYGVDDCADVMPLKNMYRSHLLQLGEYMGLPAEILNRTPNPDIMPGVTDKYKDYLDLDSQNVDLILFGLEKGMVAGEIARQLGIDKQSIADVQELMRLSAHMRNHVMAPVFSY